MDNQQNNKGFSFKALAIILIITNLCTFLLVGTGFINLPNHVTVAVSDQEMVTGIKKLSMLEKQLKRTYYQDVDTTTLMDGALRGLFAATEDPYTEYLNQDDFKNLMDATTGEFEGVGIMVTENESGQIEVIVPIKGSPAAEAGILSKDVITKVDGEEVTGKGLQSAVDKMRGKSGSAVTLEVQREGETLSFDIVREAIVNKTVDSKMIDGVGYIELNQFNEKSTEEFKTALDDLKAKGMTALVVDLRNNGGGLLDVCVEIIDLFIGEGIAVYTEDKAGNRTDYQTKAGSLWDGPMTVLVNENTASASEIFAGAMQDYERASVIGVKTFGKGVVQDVFPLRDQTGYKVTVAQYYTPDGRNIDKKGIEPDVVVELSEDLKNKLTIPQEEDTQLQKALELVVQ